MKKPCAEPDLLFRDAAEDNTARAAYNAWAGSAMAHLREAWQDSMISVRKFQEAEAEAQRIVDEMATAGASLCLAVWAVLQSSPKSRRRSRSEAGRAHSAGTSCHWLRAFGLTCPCCSMWRMR